jgi:hypothetical protein
MNDTYGPVEFGDPNAHLPLDWRHPDTHAIYWAVRGLRVSDHEHAGEIEIDETNTDAIVGHSLQNLFRNGKLIIRDVSMKVPGRDLSEGPRTVSAKEVFLRPDLRIFESYNRAALKTIEKYKDDRGTYERMRNGYRNMLRNAAFSFYQSGHEQQAEKIFLKLREDYPDLPDFKVSLKEFARLLRQSYYFYAIGDDEAAFGRESLAKQVHDHYQGKYLDENRIDLPPFEEMRYSALIDFLEDTQFIPDLRLGLLARIEIERKKLERWKEQLEEQKAKIRQQEQQLLKSYGR